MHALRIISHPLLFDGFCRLQQSDIRGLYGISPILFQEHVVLRLFPYRDDI